MLPLGSVGHPRRSALAAVGELFRTSLGDEPWRKAPPRVNPRAVCCGASVDHARANASRGRAISSCLLLDHRVAIVGRRRRRALFGHALLIARYNFLFASKKYWTSVVPRAETR